MKNSIINLFTLIRNNQGMYRDLSINKNIKLCNKILKILVCKGFIKNFYILKEKSDIEIKLKYYNKKPTIFTTLIIHSKSSFISYSALCKLTNDYETLLLSTSKGILTHKEAIFFKLGGFIICKII